MTLVDVSTARIADPNRGLARDILRIIYSKRRLSRQTCFDAAAESNACETCFSLHQGSIERSINRGEPLHLVLPAFPAKSPNRNKVLGALPDKAEELALAYLDGICRQVAAIYPPGATLTICSDGRVFSDLVGVPDESVTRYAEKLRAMVNRIGAGSIDVMRLEDVFEGEDFDRIRGMLEDRYAEPLAAIRHHVKTDPEELQLFNGIARFLFEDNLYLYPDQSRTATRNRSKELAYSVIQRSHAWSNLVTDRYPNAVRLSIHPYPAHSKKIGIFLVDTFDNWLTPWHGVALEDNGQFTLTKRSHAEGIHARLVHDAEGAPAYYSMEAR